MVIREDYTFEELKEQVWSGAVDTMETVAENDKEEELMDLLEMEFCMETPTMTEVNDFLWFETDFIFEHLGIENE